MPETEQYLQKTATIKPDEELVPKGFVVLIEDDIIMQDETSESGIIIVPKEAQERDQTAVNRGTVIDMGDKAKAEENPLCEIGDRVIFKTYAGVCFERKTGDKSQFFRLLNDTEIFSAVKPRERD